MERLLADLIAGVNHDQFESHLLVLNYLGRFSEGLSQHATLHVADPMSRLSMVRPNAVAAMIRRIDPDVVHTHSGVWYKTSLAAHMAKVPWHIHTEHGRGKPDPIVARILDGIAARRTDIVVAVSEALGEQLGRTIVHDRSRIRCILNGVDTNRFSPRPDRGRIRQELGIAPGVPIFGSVGRLEPIKGYEVLVEAMHLLTQSLATMPVLLLVGEGSERPRLETMIAERGLQDCVRILGWRDDIEDMHSAFSLFTMSSHSEGTSISLLEAMSAGVSPVVTDVGGNGAVLGPVLAHRLVPPRRADLMAAALRHAVQDPERLARDAAAARSRVLEAFSLQAMVAAYEALYLRGPRSRVASVAVPARAKAEVDVSVIIPTYNRGAWLREGIASVLQQTLRPREIIVVDDGSTDDIAGICREFPEPVSCLRQQNAGVSAARNRGIEAANGKWVAFLDSDDLWEPDKLEMQLSALEQHPDAGWCITDCTLMDVDGTRSTEVEQGFKGVFHVFRSQSPLRFFNEHFTPGVVHSSGGAHRVFTGDAFGALFLGNFALPSTAIIRREVLDRSGCFDAELWAGEETEFFHRLASVSPVVVVMSPLVRWRRGHADRLVSKANMEHLIQMALNSVDRAATLRERLRPSESQNFGRGRRTLLERMAYQQLSHLAPKEARATILEVWASDARPSAGAASIYAASFLPKRVLRLLHLAKTTVRKG